jgi:hypothetical protein
MALLIEKITFTASTRDCVITFREGVPAALTKS